MVTVDFVPFTPPPGGNPTEVTGGAQVAPENLRGNEVTAPRHPGSAAGGVGGHRGRLVFVAGDRPRPDPALGSHGGSPPSPVGRRAPPRASRWTRPKAHGLVRAASAVGVTADSPSSRPPDRRPRSRCCQTCSPRGLDAGPAARGGRAGPDRATPIVAPIRAPGRTTRSEALSEDPELAFGVCRREPTVSDGSIFQFRHVCARSLRPFVQRFHVIDVDVDHRRREYVKGPAGCGSSRLPDPT